MRNGDLGILSIVLFVLLLFSLGMWWKIYQYQDCRKVGHSVLYCVGKFFSED